MDGLTGPQHPRQAAAPGPNSFSCGDGVGPAPHQPALRAARPGPRPGPLVGPGGAAHQRMLVCRTLYSTSGDKMN